MPEGAPRTRDQRFLFWITLVVVAVTRFAALSKTMWDWDEALFSAAMVEYDVAEHRPHPPGFPLYVALAKVVRLVVASDFEALRAINLLAAVLAFPLLFALARQLRFDFTTSWLAAVLFVFLPNIWFFGGTGFSDVPAVVISVGSATLLLRGRDNARTFVIGCVIAAIGIGMRPQNALMVVYPVLAAAWPAMRTRRFGRFVVGGLAAASIVAAAFWGAVHATGSWERYRAAIDHHSNYITKVDSFRSPGRPALDKLLDDFYVDPLGGGSLVSFAIVFLVGLALLRARRGALETAAIFGPFAIFAIFMLDFHSTSRFSIAYMPMMAILAAEGAGVLGSLAARAAAAWRPQREAAIRASVPVALITAIALHLAVWGWPAVRDAATTDSPPYAAMQWVRANLDPASQLWVQGSMTSFATYYLSDYDYRSFDGSSPLAQGVDAREEWTVSEGLPDSEPAVVFQRPRGRLWKIARQRYFETYVGSRQKTSVEFAEGWHSSESDGRIVWRWMGRESRTLLSGVPGKASLVIEFYVPLDTSPVAPEVTILLNGVPVDRFFARTPEISRSYQLAGNEDRNELRIVLDRAVNPLQMRIGSDPRDLGLRLNSLYWASVE